MEEPKHIFFDLDNTLCESRQKISKEMEEALESLIEHKDVVIVSGAKRRQMRKQLGNNIYKKVYIMSLSGNEARCPNGELWRDFLLDRHKKVILEHIKLLKKKYSKLLEGTKKSDLIQDRKCQISFSWVGHNAPREKKDSFDVDKKKRSKILKETPLVSEAVEVSFGGTTCFDYTRKGRNKGYGIKRLARENGWKLEDCVYIGDAIFPGGNDGTVIGVCPTRSVRNPIDTLSLLVA